MAAASKCKACGRCADQRYPAGQRRAEALGGSIKILGDVPMLKNASVEASGTAGGGEILIGGNYLGQGPEPNASATVWLMAPVWRPMPSKPAMVAA